MVLFVTGRRCRISLILSRKLTGFAMHATLREAHLQALAASVTVQDVGEHVVLAHPIRVL